MASLYDALIGEGDLSSYEAQDPFYSSGLNIAKIPLPQATTNAEAIFGPTIRGFLSGALMGYGKEEARQAAYNEARANPLLQNYQYSNPINNFIGPLSEEQQQLNLKDALLHDYSSATAPEGWTPNIARTDKILSAIQQQALQEEAIKKAALRQELAQKVELAINPEIRGAELADKIVFEKEKAKIEKTGKDEKDWFEKIPVATRTKVLDAEASTRELYEIGQELKKLDAGTIEFQTKRHISGTTANDLISKMSLLIPKVSRLAGEVGNLADQEQARNIAATLGNFTSNSKEAGQRVETAAKLYRDLTAKLLEAGKKGYDPTQGGDALLQDLKNPLGGTSQVPSITKEEIIAELKRRGAIP